MNADLSFIIVTWNASDTIARCLDSVLAQAPDAEVIVIDNHSSDGAAESVEKRYPSVRVIRNARNDGFGRACNQGASLARGKYLLFLNPDAKMEPGCVAKLLDVMRRPETDVAGPILRESSGRVASAGRQFLTLGRYFVCHVLGVRIVRVPKSATQVDWVSGAALLIRRRCFEDLGGFDERFWMYVEDMHLCWKANAKGRRVVIVPDAVVTHDHGTSAKKNLEQVLRHQVAGTLLWFAETGKRKNALAVRLLIFSSFIAIGTKQSLLGRSIRPITGYLKLGWVVLTAPGEFDKSGSMVRLPETTHANPADCSGYE